MKLRPQGVRRGLAMIFAVLTLAGLSGAAAATAGTVHWQAKPGEQLKPGDSWTGYDRPGADAPSSAILQPLTTTALQRYAISTTDWATLRNTVAHYVIALGHDAWGDDVSQHSGDGKWYYGFVNGASDSLVQACAWILAANLTPASNAPSFDCTPYPDTSPSAFMQFYDGNVVGANWQCNNRQV